MRWEQTQLGNVVLTGTDSEALTEGKCGHHPGSRTRLAGSSNLFLSHDPHPLPLRHSQRPWGQEVSAPPPPPFLAASPVSSTAMWPLELPFVPLLILKKLNRAPIILHQRVQWDAVDVSLVTSAKVKLYNSREAGFRMSWTLQVVTC